MAEFSPSADRLAIVFGGSGFVGRHIVRALARDGWRIRVAVRRPDLAGFLRPLGVVGQIEPVEANLRDPDSVAAALEGADAVVNATGVRHRAAADARGGACGQGPARSPAPRRRPASPALVHVSGTRRRRGARRNPYIASKGRGEARGARGGVPGGDRAAPIGRVRPRGRFSQPFRRAGAHACRRCRCSAAARPKLQPVFVGDVALAALRRALDGAARGRATPTSSAARRC